MIFVIFAVLLIYYFFIMRLISFLKDRLFVFKCRMVVVLRFLLYVLALCWVNVGVVVLYCYRGVSWCYFRLVGLFGGFVVRSTKPLCRATVGSSGYELRANIKEPAILQPGVPTLIPTGVKLRIPYGYEAQVRSRSGLALKHSVVVANSPGTIDSDYRGEIGVILVNAKQQIFEIQPNASIAQLVFVRVEYPSVELVDDVVVDTDRGEGGFGSTDTIVKEFKKD